MLKNIYGIMERYASDEIWPDYDEHPVNMGTTTFVMETTTDGERIAYLVQVDEEQLGERKVYRFDLEVPKEFPKRWFVNKYQLTREYGGPEEGGWYWDCYTPMKSIQCPDQTSAEALFAGMDSEIDHEEQEKNPYYNVNSDGHEVLMLENHPPIEPRRPHYE